MTLACDKGMPFLTYKIVLTENSAVSGGINNDLGDNTKEKVNIKENTPEPVEETKPVETAEYTEIQENGAKNSL